MNMPCRTPINPLRRTTTIQMIAPSRTSSVRIVVVMNRTAWRRARNTENGRIPNPSANVISAIHCRSLPSIASRASCPAATPASRYAIAPTPRLAGSNSQKAVLMTPRCPASSL